MACTATEREYRIERSSQPHSQVYLVPEITASAFLYSMMVMFHGVERFLMYKQPSGYTHLIHTSYITQFYQNILGCVGARTLKTKIAKKDV
jgi:hypothetical protein